MVPKEKSEDQQSDGDSSRWGPWMSVQHFMVIGQIVGLFHSGGPTGWLISRVILFKQGTQMSKQESGKHYNNIHLSIISVAPAATQRCSKLNESPLKLLSLCWTSRRGWEGELMEHSETLFIIFLRLCDGFSTAVIYFSRKSVVLTVSL